jgi:hypothetical protein
MIQFQSQLEAVESPTPRERMGRGKISPSNGVSFYDKLGETGNYR